MATDLHIRVYQNPYRGYEARFVWNGLLYRYSFELRTELACMLVDDSVEQDVIDKVMDSLDDLEWSKPEYPLGVTFVGEAVSDSPLDEPVYPPGSVGYEMQRFAAPSPFWEWAAATLRIGAVTAPWVLLMLLGRMAWGWL